MPSTTQDTGLIDPNIESGYKPPKFDTNGLLDDSVRDINTLTAQDNPLMKQARTRGRTEGNSRGLLNSTMSGQAAESAVLDTVMPLVQQNAQTRGSAALQNNDVSNKFQLNDQALDNDISLQNNDTKNQTSLLNTKYGIDSKLMNQEFSGKENLINLEQEWSKLIQGNINAAESWRTDMDGILDILNNKDLTPDQVDNRLYLAFGSDGSDGRKPSKGYVSANLEFLSNLEGVPFPGISGDVRSQRLVNPADNTPEIDFDPGGYDDY